MSENNWNSVYESRKNERRKQIRNKQIREHLKDSTRKHIRPVRMY